MTVREKLSRFTTCLCSLVVGGLVFWPQVVLADQQFDIKRFDGSTITGSVASIDAEGNIAGSDLPDSLQLSDIVSLDAGRSAKRLPNFGVTVYLINGGKIFVREPVISEDKVSFRTGCKLAEIPLQSLSAIVWNESPTVQRQIANPSPDRDAVLVATNDGERGVEGIVEQLAGEQLQINYQGESRKIGIAKINAIVMADLGLPSPGDSLATIRMTDDSTVVGRISGLLGDALTVAVTGGSLELDINAVVSISIPSDRLIFLSDLEPLEVQQKTEFAALRSWRKDLSVEGRPLSLRYGNSEKVEEFKKGLGTQAFCLLVFPNSNDFDRFRAVVGIDAETQGRGDCQMVVLGDDIELWSGRIRGSDDPWEVDVDITGINRISLVVYPGEDFDLADHADWCIARFVKTK